MEKTTYRTVERFSTPVRNGLHGYQTHLVSKLRDGSVPLWLYPSHPVEHAGGIQITINDPNPRNGFLNEWMEIASQRHSKTTVSYQLFTNRSEARDASFPFFTRRPEIVLAPTEIRQRCREYLDSPRHRSEMRTLGECGTFDGFHTDVVIGPQGGIQDIILTADYLR